MGSFQQRVFYYLSSTSHSSQYIAFQFWRLPCYDAYADEYIASLDLSKFGEKLIMNENYVGKTKNIKKMLKSDSGFKHYKAIKLKP